VFATVVGSLLWLAAAAVPEALAGDLTGTAEDKSGGALAGARIIVMTPTRSVVATTTTDQSGKFTVSGLPDGSYLIVAQYPSMADRQINVTLSATSKPLKLVLDVASVKENVVTVSPGALEERLGTSQPVNVIPEDEIFARTKTVVAQVADGEPGVNLQRTSPGMAGIFVRGLTGNKVNIFIDGVRYSTGGQRGGVNTFLDMIDPSTLERVDIIRGTSSAQYGSDALGGSIQFQTHVPSLLTGQRRVHGMVNFGAESAHQGGFGGGAVGYSKEKYGVFGSVSMRKTGDYRPGGGFDTHAAVTRYLGVGSQLLYGDTMPGTGFEQFSGQARANFVLANNMTFVANYIGSRQDGANRWDQMLGGDGNLIASLDDLKLDLFYARLERMNTAGFDHASVTYSVNTQREERINQGGNGDATAAINHEPERTTVHGVQFSGTRRLSDRSSILIGGDTYLESVSALSTAVTPPTATTFAETDRRGRVPHGATYKQGGVFAQTTYDVAPGRVAVVGAVRAGFNKYNASATDSPVVSGQPLWPDDSLSVGGVTFRGGITMIPNSHVTVTAAFGTGYRAPHISDLGTLGLTGAGFEVAAPDLVAAGITGAFVGSSAAASAVATTLPVEQVKSERSRNVEMGLYLRGAKARMQLNAFLNNIYDNIQKQALILPAGAVGTVLGGSPITTQNPSGTVLVALSTAPVLVRANFDNARVYGWEWSGDYAPTPNVTVGSTFTYMRAEDTTTGLAPNIEGGTPAPGGTLWARYSPKGARWWLQPYMVFAARQSHLSSLDATDRRTGAERTRGSIQNFFRRGARARGWVNAGADGIVNNADDILIPTGETLLQVQDRVLGVGVNSSNLWSAVPAYQLYGVRFGVRIGQHAVLVDAENLTNESYRGISWGMDGSARGVTVRYQLKF